MSEDEKSYADERGDLENDGNKPQRDKSLHDSIVKCTKQQIVKKVTEAIKSAEQQLSKKLVVRKQQKAEINIDIVEPEQQRLRFLNIDMIKEIMSKILHGTITPDELIQFGRFYIPLNPIVEDFAEKWYQFMNCSSAHQIDTAKKQLLQHSDNQHAEKGFTVNEEGRMCCSVCKISFFTTSLCDQHLYAKTHRKALKRLEEQNLMKQQRKEEKDEQLHVLEERKSSQQLCVICRKCFESRNQLYKHLLET